MRIRVYAISLLISFLLILSHEMIPHHHHEFAAVNVDPLHGHAHKHHEYPHPHHHFHEPENGHNEHNDKDEGHDHSFPFHQHFLAEHDLQYLRTNVERSIQLDHIKKFDHGLDVFITDQGQPPKKDPTKFKTGQSCIFEYFFYRSSNPLRAPPNQRV